jgi:glycosyltransferase involved in cell wall biosynthesis
VRLGIVYHMPCWRDASGSLREIEGSFARYVDSLAPYFDEISLCVPVIETPAGEGTPIRSPNVTLAPLPPFDGPRQFYPRLISVIPRLVTWVGRIDVLHCRIPTPAAAFAFAIARLFRRPTFVLVIGDLQALLPSMPYRGIKRGLWRAYTAFEEWNVQWMVDRSLAFANGAALAAKHGRPSHSVVETITTTIRDGDVSTKPDTCEGPRIRALTVSRIDPRKNLRVLPAAVRMLVDRNVDITVDLVGPTVGKPGADERAAIVEESRRLGVESRVGLRGAIPLNSLLPAYGEYDVFVLPTLPGEGIPRVLLEAMSAGLPVVTTRVAGIPSLVVDGVNGLLVDDASSASVAAAVGRVIEDGALRRRLIAGGYATARQFTLEIQTAKMMSAVAQGLDVKLRQSAIVPAA